MHLKHVRLYKRHSNLKKSKRKLTLNHFNAILRCNALILKMARIRFPGRPGQRIGKTYVKYVHDDVKMNVDSCVVSNNKIQVGLQLFYELFGYSDEEEEFEGFTNEDLAIAEAAVARQLKTKEAIHRYLADPSQELSSSAASDLEKAFSSSDSETSSSSSLRQKRGMRDILRRSYDKMLKHGLDMKGKDLFSNKSEKSNNLKKILENKVCDFQEKLPLLKVQNIGPLIMVENQCRFAKSETVKINPCPKSTFVKHGKKPNKLKTHRGRRQSLRASVKKKYRKHFLYSAKKYSKSMKKITRSSTRGKFQNKTIKSKLLTENKTVPKLETKSKLLDSLPSDKNISKKPKHSVSVAKTNIAYSVSKSENKVDSCSSHVSTSAESAPKQKRSLSRKRFVLPSISARSSRKIIPRRRYIDESEHLLKKITNEDSQGSQSSLSGSSEAIYAMDGESSPDDTLQENSANLKKVGLLDQPLVVEGRRRWKPSLKVQMKLSNMNCDYPFELKKTLDGSSGTSSGSFKDIIKPDMVSKYAEKMAQKPKEKALNVQNVNKESEETENDSTDSSEGLKKGDKLKKVAKKIEKILKSQWEGRLKNSKQPSNKLSSELVAHWKTERQQRQRRTKSILRKARLQLKKRNSNLRTRQSVKQIREADIATKEKNLGNSSKVDSVDQSSENILGVPIPVGLPNSADCLICGSAELSISSNNFFGTTCETCFKFFEGFIKTPKQYFCKDGNCCIDSKEPTPRRASNFRCKACWVKRCLQNLTVSDTTKEELMKHVPRYDAPPHNSLLAAEEDDALVGLNAISKGPRIKHVCRRQAVALGLPRARFSVSEETFNLSALPVSEKIKIFETAPPAENSPLNLETQSTKSVPKPARPPVKRKVTNKKNKISANLLKKSARFIYNEQKKKKLQMKKTAKRFHKRSFKKSSRLEKKSLAKKIVQVKTTMPTIRPRCRKVRCKQCKGCLSVDCGKCAYCLDKKKFGGPNLVKQACMHRRCLRPALPASDRKPVKTSLSIVDNKSPSGGSFVSSSSSPSSPSGSSCGSSCSSSSSSSGSTPSSSSTKSTSSSTSSKNTNSTSNSLLINKCVKSSLMPNYESQSIILQPQFSEVETFPINRCPDSSYVSQPNELTYKAIYGDYNMNYQENGDGDTILYEDSSSIIELKNASFTPSLIYSAASLGDETGSSNSGSRSSGSQSRSCKQTHLVDKDPYGSAGSASNGDDNEDEDEDDNKKHYILADYWEDYDFERITSQGFALISSQQLSLPCVCYLCGSAGQEKLIFCVLCCEPFHTFCLSEEDVPSAENIENWCCKKCQSCAVCGSKNNLLKCKKCQNTYHAECLAPHYPTKPSRKKRIWVCPKCVKCKSCGVTASSLNAGLLWNFDSLLCHACSKLTNKGIECF